MNPSERWDRYRRYLCQVPALDLTLDFSRMTFDDALFERMASAMMSAHQAMDALESGAIANPTEQRMVGHYWLRAPDLAPTSEIRTDIRETVTAIKTFAADIHQAQTRPPIAERFTQVLSIGVGGSALGPMFMADALGRDTNDRLSMHFIDNTDSDGMDRVLARLAGKLPETLCIVISKSGGTSETRNGMLVVADAYRRAGLNFAQHAVAVTGAGSHLDKQADIDGWLARFPMWDWVGGRTSVTSTVGLLPAALQGIDIDDLLAGAADCDERTRMHDTMSNPAALLALMWHHATGGMGDRHMVVLPYKDRLVLLGRYLQQLVMESLGKGEDLEGNRVEQGLTVYGNKGSTDQHAYVQQLRDGVNNFYVMFIRVLESGGAALDVEPGITSGDYLHGFWLGTREALSDNNRPSMTITVNRVDARTLGALIALFERAVGFYASLIGVNAYDQPGVEAGKRAASAALALQTRVAGTLSAIPQTPEQIATAIGAADQVETVLALLEHLAANGRAKCVRDGRPDCQTFCQAG